MLSSIKEARKRLEFVLEEEERAAVQHICIKEPYILLRKVTIALGIQFISDFTLILGVSTLGPETNILLKDSSTCSDRDRDFFVLPSYCN